MALVVDEVLVICKKCGEQRYATAEACARLRCAEDVSALVHSMGSCPGCGHNVCDFRTAMPKDLVN